jgi:hypothetical protein
MLIVWPTDADDFNVWAPIMDTAIRGIVDGHDHTTSKGVKIPAAALNINDDVTFGGHSATNLAAVDFAAVAAAVVAGFAGALFLNSADNELYWRNTSGTNVKLTAGAALNVAAFTGGIGGDYAAVGALVVFDDGTDSYWFQQQLGTGVRQYARMRSADVDLYEFKANPAAGVPTQRVRLASPAALAASYTLTMPAALPAVKALVQVDSTGALTVAASNTKNYSMAFASGTISNGGDIPLLQLSSVIGFLPLELRVGETISAWSFFFQKASDNTVTISADLWEVNLSTSSSVKIGATQTTNAAGTVNSSIGQAGLAKVVQAGRTYHIQVSHNSGATDFGTGYSVTV